MNKPACCLKAAVINELCCYYKEIISSKQMILNYLELMLESHLLVINNFKLCSGWIMRERCVIGSVYTERLEGLYHKNTVRHRRSLLACHWTCLMHCSLTSYFYVYKITHRSCLQYILIMLICPRRPTQQLWMLRFASATAQHDFFLPFKSEFILCCSSEGFAWHHSQVKRRKKKRKKTCLFERVG